MSRRFGRNQRRRAREQIASLQYAHEMDRALLRHQSDKLADLRKEIAMAKEIAGRMSVLFPAREVVKVELKSSDGIPVRVTTDRPDNQMHRFTDEITPMECIQAVDLEKLVSRIEVSRIDSSVHTYIQFSDKKLAYGISASAWHSMSRSARKQRIIEVLPKLFADELAKYELGGGRI